MDLFWHDSSNKISKTYQDFFSELLREGINNNYVQEANPYIAYLSLIRNLLNNRSPILLDSDFSPQELEGLEMTSKIIDNGKYSQKSLENKFRDLPAVLAHLHENADQLKIEIFTSGTTGRPKKVGQNLKNLTRSVKKDKKNQSNTWAFAYNPTHFAGLQVFFQAFLNKNAMVYIFGSAFDVAVRDIQQNRVTHISCTPTFMKFLLPYVTDAISAVQVLTFGGERFDSRVEEEIREKFPNAKLRNIYASTEAGSLLATNGRAFTIPERLSKHLKITDDRELAIHKDLLGTSESFNLVDDWYHSGDIVEFIGEDEFVFKNRKSDFINVGGYKVNPEEVESLITQVPGIRDAQVLGRKNSITGNILMAKVIIEPKTDTTEIKRKIKEYLTKNLQEWKIPRSIKIVESFDLTRTGKIKKE